MEDQCAIPIFKGLLPKEHDKTILELLFELETWHMLASLRLHTDSTLRALKDSTTRLGQLLRHFQSTTCTAYETYKLPSEEAASVATHYFIKVARTTRGLSWR
jgi:hypothetical protein